jgi:flagellar P-ring protein precursor FlgI
VVVDQRSGTIVLGADVTISRVAVAQGSLTIRITETPLPSQPNPFTDGETLVVPRTTIGINQGGDSRMALVEGNVTLADLVDGLNALGVGPRDMIDILKARSRPPARCTRNCWCSNARWGAQAGAQGA